MAFQSQSQSQHQGERRLSQQQFQGDERRARPWPYGGSYREPDEGDLPRVTPMSSEDRKAEQQERAKAQQREGHNKH